MNLDPAAVEAALTPRTKAILPIHFAGLPCDMEAIHAIARARNLVVIEDAAHALGAEIGGRRIGGLSHLTTFSFHPVKHITTGEGGMVTTNEPALADRLRRFRNHGIDREVRQRQATTPAAWRQDMVTFGFNYRLTDIHSALGLSQLRRLDARLQAPRGDRRPIPAGLRRPPGGDRGPHAPGDAPCLAHLSPPG